MKIDLHSHSYYSDGVLSPQALVKLAYQQNCKILALCDHDSTNGLFEAKQQADLLGLNLINSVEISTTWQQQTIHIVGLNINKENKFLQDGLNQHQNFRILRAKEMAKQLEAVGIKDAYQHTKALAPHILTRTHFAQMLIKQGVCRDMRSVFKRFLRKGNPGAITDLWSPLAEVVNWIKQSGGLAVLAHPFRYRLNEKKIKQLLAHFKDCDGAGLEVVVSGSTNKEIALAEKLTKKYGLLSSLGSDYHGWAGEKRQLGLLKPLPNRTNSVMNALTLQ